MDVQQLYPFVDDSGWFLRHCKLPVHKGRGQVGEDDGDTDDPLSQFVREFRATASVPAPEAADNSFAAECFIPASGGCKLLLTWPVKGCFSRNFGKDLVVEGVCEDGTFRLKCPQYYVSAVSEHGNHPGWAVASPVNDPLTISYGEERAVASVEAVINNFDFEHGNIRTEGNAKHGEILRVKAGDVSLDFIQRPNRRELRRLVDAGLLGTTAFATFRFEPWPAATENDLIEFAHNVAALCSYVVGQHTGVPVITFADANGKAVKRVIGNPVESKFRSATALQILNAERGLPQLFRESFAEHCQLQKSKLWRRLPKTYACIEDPPYLEQKFSSLMACVELFIRNSLIEHGMSESDAESKFLPGLVGAAKGTLRWNVPSHYTEGDRYRTTRNAAGHGGSLPHDPKQVRNDFDKWKLFLMRRLFIRLGFKGEVASPNDGWASSSPVDEFSEEHNAFSKRKKVTS